MQPLIHHPTHADPAESPWSLKQAASRVGTWIWPPIETDAAARPDELDAEHPQDPDVPLWSMKTMHWVPLVVPLAAVLMLFMAVLVGSRLY